MTQSFGAPTAVWTHKSDVVFLINPSKRKRVIGGLAVILAVAVFVLSGEAERLITQEKKESQREVMAATMRELAAAGKPLARLWLAKNYASESYRLDQLVQERNPEAMYLLGLKKLRDGDQQGGGKLIADAAAEGFPEAVLSKKIVK